MKSLLSTLAALFLISCSGHHSELPLEQKAAKLLITGFPATSLDEQSAVVEDIKSGISGVILFEKNIEGGKEESDPRGRFKQLVTDLKSVRSEPLLVSIDQEGGMVNRLKSKYGFQDMPSQQSVGEADSDEHATQVAQTIASELSDMGINLNFSPCVDVNINPQCPVIGRYKRSFSADENRVSQLSKIYIEEYHKEGIITSLKHFPGHGSSLRDSHFGLTDITQTWQQHRELTPYRELIDSKHCDIVMVGHLYNKSIDPIYPASLSHATIDSLLRGVLNWKGVVITDDMQMRAIVNHYGFEEAIILGINAGVDLFIIGSNIHEDDFSVRERFIQTILDGVKNGAISEKQINRSVRRINRLMNRLY